VGDADGEPMRCYPTPNLVVANYLVGDFVRIAGA
jgi:hypothetical protein